MDINRIKNSAIWKWFEKRYQLNRYFAEWQIDRLLLIYVYIKEGHLNDVSEKCFLRDKNDLLIIYAQYLNPNVAMINRYLISRGINEMQKKGCYEIHQCNYI